MDCEINLVGWDQHKKVCHTPETSNNVNYISIKKRFKKIKATEHTRRHHTVHTTFVLSIHLTILES